MAGFLYCERCVFAPRSRGRAQRERQSALGAWRSFEAARTFARGLGLTSAREWAKYVRGELPGRDPPPPDIPASPRGAYRDDGWCGYDDWLGTGRERPRTRSGHLRGAWRPFEDARQFARSLDLRSEDEWKAFCRGLMPEKGERPHDIPEKPYREYRDQGWVSLPDWLGTSTTVPYRGKWRPFEEARAFVRTLGLATQSEWRAWRRGALPGKPPRPRDIPTGPEAVYPEFTTYADWLGYSWRPFVEARTFVRSLGLRTAEEWRAYCHGELPEKGARPTDIPLYPNETYEESGWLGYPDWLGVPVPANVAWRYGAQPRPFESARAFARSLGLASHDEWVAFCRGEMPAKGLRPEDVPWNPARTYKDSGWKGFRDWLGNEVRPRRARGMVASPSGETETTTTMEEDSMKATNTARQTVHRSLRKALANVVVVNNSLAPFHALKEQVVHAFEEEYLIAVLTVAGGNIAKAARLAGLDKKNLHHKIREFALDPKTFKKKKK